MSNPRIAVCCTFPNSQFEICAAEMLATFKQYWPEDIKMYISLDEQPKETFDDLNNKILDICGTGKVFFAGKYDKAQRNFIKKWKDHKPKSYLDEVVKFSHKVFALEKCADAIKDDIDYLIWLDADVITKHPLDYDWLKEVLPEANQVVSYLNRKELHSECGFVAYNLRAGGYELLKQMKEEYILDGIKKYKKGMTDCHVLDFCLHGKEFKNLSPDYIYGKSDINVWPTTKLAEKMAHRKGNRKYEVKKNRDVKVNGQTQQLGQIPAGVVDCNNVSIKTRNCLDHDKIKANVAANLSQIRAWATLCQPSAPIMPRSREIVICAAGPSLANHIEEIKKLQADGAKIVCVKHAINTLKAHGVKPWAVVLLDPRAHVEGFVQNPDPDVIYFVASMCDPSVVKTLNDNKCRIIGYHAAVGAGEMALMVPSDLPVSGGSATSTRSIALFADMLGFKKLHLFGYDLSHQLRPNMEEKNPDGNLKYMEVNIGSSTWGGKYVSRTFFTEGQLLAQNNELANLYKDRKDIEMEIYGDGLPAWQYRHWKLYKKYQAEYNSKLELKRDNTPTIDEFINAVTRGSDLSRGI